MRTVQLQERGLPAGWVRESTQEDKRVFRWFEKDDIIASFVTRTPQEVELRVSWNYGSFCVPIYLSVFRDQTDQELIAFIETHMAREGMLS